MPQLREGYRRRLALAAIRSVHTLIWAFLVACIVAIPAAAAARRFTAVLWLTLVVLGECGALALNGGRCPITNLASRFTEERHLGFDIYLPGWVARHNKAIFGSLFLAGEVFSLTCWLRR